MTTYFGNPSTPAIRAAMKAGLLGAITTPDQRTAVPDGVPWIADNGLGPGRGGMKAGKGGRTDAAWFAWLEGRPWDRALCRFAVAPDVIGDAAATLARATPWLPRMKAAGYPTAYVAQNGFDPDVIPWDVVDVLFIGGDDAFKLGPDGAAAASSARARGKRVHVGRVNSLKRLRYAIAIGGDDVTADGTFLAFAPDHNLGRLARWMDAVTGEPTLPHPEGVDA